MLSWRVLTGLCHIRLSNSGGLPSLAVLLLFCCLLGFIVFNIASLPGGNVSADGSSYASDTPKILGTLAVDILLVDHFCIWLYTKSHTCQHVNPPSLNCSTSNHVTTPSPMLFNLLSASVACCTCEMDLTVFLEFPCSLEIPSSVAVRLRNQ
jgi:hypothetical protein